MWWAAFTENSARLRQPRHDALGVVEVLPRGLDDLTLCCGLEFEHPVSTPRIPRAGAFIRCALAADRSCETQLPPAGLEPEHFCNQEKRCAWDLVE